MAHREKLDRARHHLITLNGLTSDFIASDPYRDRREQNERPGGFTEVVVHWTQVQHLPGEIPFVIGAALYNMRSALDHLAFSLSVKGASPIVEDRVSFPIFTSKDKFEERGLNALQYMAGAAKAKIIGLQPYHAGNGASDHPLAVLNTLGSIDKHRHQAYEGHICSDTEFVLDAARSRDVDFTPVQSEVFRGALDNQDDVARLLFKNTGPNPQCHLQAIIRIDITFPDPGPSAGKLVFDELERMYKFIRDEVFPVLEPEL